MKHSISLFILLVQAIFATAQLNSPTAFGKKVKFMPKSYERPSDQSRTDDHHGRTSTGWIVYSDRAGNVTTTSPGGSLMMKSLKFSEAFYVSAEKKGFVKLLPYKSGMVRGRKLIDKKSAISYGWISKSKLLLWQKAFSNTTSGFMQKAIPVISGSKPLIEPALFYDETDSIYVYDSPLLKNKRAKIRLHEITYIFKKSEDGKKYLIGNESQIMTDSTSSGILGWVAAEALHPWGERLYICPTNNVNADSVSMMLRQTPADPLLDSTQIILSAAPVLGSQQNQLVLANANNIYDKSKNEILSISGKMLSYQDYISYRNNKKNINIVFVVDGGSSMMRHSAAVNNAVQSFEHTFKEYSDRHRLNYAAVVYRSGSGCKVSGVSYSSALQPDYRNVTQMLATEAKKTDSCIGIIVEQPVYNGLQAGLSLFKEHQHETNLIILIGSTGNISVPQEEWNQLFSAFTDADARLLSLQAYSDFNPAFNNFVLQSKMLVSEPAVLSAQNKKNYLVSDDALRNTQEYNVSQQDSISYYLDYPRNSLIQGGVVFPTKGIANSRGMMGSALRRLMKETDDDIFRQLKALDSAFRLTGISHDNLVPAVKDQLEAPVAPQVADRMPHNAFKYYMTSKVPADLMTKNKGLLQYAVLLDTLEYRQFNDVFSLMAGENIEADHSSFRKKLRKNYMDIARTLVGLHLSKNAIKSMTLSTYIRAVSGLPLDHQLLNRYKVADLKKESRMPRAEFERYLAFLKLSVDHARAKALTGQQFISNGKTYYYITEQNFSPAHEGPDQQQP